MSRDHKYVIDFGLVYIIVIVVTPTVCRIILIIMLFPVCTKMAEVLLLESVTLKGGRKQDFD